MERRRLTATPAGVRLCAAAEIERLGSRSLVLKIGEAYFHGFLAAAEGGAVVGYVDLCPHMGLPLESPSQDYLSPDRRMIVCARHGAMFEPGSGACVAGPCLGGRLTPWPVAVRDGVVWTA